jgi:hypothetical protein
MRLKFDKFKLLGFKEGPPPKKYTAVLEDKRTGRRYEVHFGDRNYQHYKDNTGLGIWSHLDHGDVKRRRAYHSRHRYDKLNEYSPGHFSYYYLW